MHHQDTASDSIADPGQEAGSRFALSLPAKPEFVALSRLTVGSLGLILELDAETVADLKIVLTEACSLVMGSGGSADEGSLGVDIHVDSNTWRVKVAGPRAGSDTTSGTTSGAPDPAVSVAPTPAPGLPAPESDPAGISLMLIQALADEVEFIQDDSGAVLRFTIRMS
ncbi:MAG: ATP-binding protein [Actinobacteria bacterium]|nr:ATP-binding protein [Actinomycetota bacterium]